MLRYVLILLGNLGIPYFLLLIRVRGGVTSVNNVTKPFRKKATAGFPDCSSHRKTFRQHCGRFFCAKYHILARQIPFGGFFVRPFRSPFAQKIQTKGRLLFRDSRSSLFGSILKGRPMMLSDCPHAEQFDMARQMVLCDFLFEHQVRR